VSGAVGLWLASLTVAALLAGCADEPTDDPRPQPDEAAEIRDRELAALPSDPNFVGRPEIDVNCKRYFCTARLASSDPLNVPWPRDKWSITDAEPVLEGEGSAIVGFVEADTRFACMKKFKESHSITHLKPCLGAVSKEPL
jgi:hypothetical protein